jgi:hypothetical protein
MLVLENESQHGTFFKVPDGNKKEREGETLKGNKSRMLDPAKVTVVTVANDLEFLLYYPTLSGVQRQQRQANWLVFAQKCKDAIPELGQLTLYSAASTRPPSCRTGLHDVYTMYEEIGRGEYGIVRRVAARSSGAVYAAKEFFKVKRKQDAQNLLEIAILMGVSHVRAD